MMGTVVTGATGFVGGHLLDRLGESASVVGWCRPLGRPPDEQRTCQWRAVDLGDAASVRAAVQDAAPGRIFHLGGAANVESSFQNAVPHLRANALGSHHLFDSLRGMAAPCRVLAVTSAQIYRVHAGPMDEESPIANSSPYGLSKLAADQLARFAADDGLDVVIARPFNHIGPRQAGGFAVSSFARQVARIEAGLADPVISVGNLDTRRDITDVRDVVDAYVRLMESGLGGRTYNVCSGVAHRMGDLLDQLVALARVRVRVEVDPARLRPLDQPVVLGNPTRLRDEIGWAPRIPIGQTLEDTLEWWRGQVQGAKGA
jgi:GDP-4-dehydro-6-deoxy-D-mannose reductase